jgi:hypothetical protein
MRVERRLPALSSFRGHKPTHEMKCAAVGKRFMSVPISATITRGCELSNSRHADQQGDKWTKGSRLASTSLSTLLFVIWRNIVLAVSCAPACPHGQELPRCQRAKAKFVTGMQFKSYLGDAVRARSE